MRNEVKAHMGWAGQRLDGLGGYRGVAGTDDGTWHVVTLPEGGRFAEGELSFTDGEVVTLAERVLRGDRDAMRTPGLLRKLAGFALLQGGHGTSADVPHEVTVALPREQAIERGAA